MFLVSREELFTIHIKEEQIKNIERFEKKFEDEEFFPILNFIESKGLSIPIPTILDGWDATFIYKKLNEASLPLGTVAEELSLFIYMRLKRRNPISIQHSGLLNGSLPLRMYN